MYDATALDGLPGIAPLRAACADPDRAARTTLRALLGPATRFAREHGVDGRTSPEAFRRAVPIRSHPSHLPWIARVLDGEPDVLFAGPTVLVARTTGTTGEPKLLPQSRAAIQAFREIQGWWGAALLRDQPEVTAGRWLSLVYPRHLEPGSLVGTVPGLGVAHGGAIGGRVDELPASIHAEPDPERRLAEVLRFAVQRDLSLIGAPVPSLSLALLDGLAAAGEALCDAVDDPARSRFLHELLARDGRLTPRRVWPRLCAVACWRSGPSSRYLPRLAERIGELPVREVGYAASEGQLSCALWPNAAGGLLTATHYLFELVPDGIAPGPATETVLPQDAEIGSAYRLIVTTPAGLYRYDTEDVVAVVGRVGRLPVVEFVRRVGVAGAAGERLTEGQLVAAVLSAGAPVVDFVGQAVWPAEGTPFWRVSVVMGGETPPDLAGAIDRALQAGNELYARRRISGALGPLQVARVSVIEGSKAGHLEVKVGPD